MIRKALIGIAASLALAAGSADALAQVGTAITYQGVLKNAGAPVNSATDFEFRLFTAAVAGSQVGSTVTQLAVPVNQGLFTSSVDFGVNPYTADQALFLQIDVRNPAGSGSYVPMGSRQRLTASPFSLATRGVNVNANGRVGVLASPTSTNTLTLGSSGGGFPASNILFAPGSGFNWSVSAFNQAGGYGGFTLSRSGVDFPLVVAGDTSDFLINQSSAGKVGIGTNIPGARLDVNGTARVGGRMSVSGTAPIGQAGSGLWINGNDNGPLFPAGTAEVGIRIFNNSVAPGASTIQGWDYMTSLARDIVINDDGGRVGIGTASPSQKLDVNGNAKLNGRVGILADPFFTNDVGLTLGSAGGAFPASTILFKSNIGSNWSVAAFEAAGAYGDFTIGRSGTDFPFIINGASGNVGINTQPAANVKLHVRQGTNANGVIRIDSGASAAQYSIVGFSDRGTQVWSCGLRPDGMFGIDRDGINTMLQIDQVGRIGMGGAVPTAGRQVNVQGGAFCTGSVWTNACDKNLKEDFNEVNPEEVLAKVASLPISTWRYKGNDKLHVGPTAQDFRAAFGLGENDTSIGTVDADGVSLAAIKGLNSRLTAKDSEIAGLRARLDKLEAALAQQVTKAEK